MTDTIADMLTRIRNGLMAGHDQIVVPHSKLKLAILEIFHTQGFVGDVKVSGKAPFQLITVQLASKRSLSKLDRISKPGRRIYTASRDIPMVLSGRGVVIVSTSKGLMTGRDARKQGLGGELICRVW